RRRSLVVALGKIATIEDDDAVRALIETTRAARDDQTRHFALIALAEIGARDAEPDRHEDAQRTLRAFFRSELSGARFITHRPYAALALAVYARNPRLSDAVRAGCVRAIAEAFDATTNPSHAGAMAIALGLLGARDQAPRLWQRFEESNDQPLKGYLAVALGL